MLLNLVKGVQVRLKQALTTKKRRSGLGWWQVKYLKHLPVSSQNSIQLFGRRFYFSNPLELMNVLEEIFEEQLYKQELPENAYILDCGANIGMSLIYLKQLCPSAEIVAFEPDETNLKLLQKNINSYGLDKISLQAAAVWKSDGFLNFFSEGTMSSKIIDGSGNGGESVIQVKSVRLKQWLNRPVDFLKLDIEGAEFEVLVDIAEDLKCVRHLFVEYHGLMNQTEKLTSILQIIEKAGFQLYIKEAANILDSPFSGRKNFEGQWDVQLNIFGIRPNVKAGI